jgi:queuine/archaeosine tRNA-ribosyltransferase
MFAHRRSFKIGDETIKTPLLVPSYSSRAGGQAVTEIIKVTQEFVKRDILVSAYDIKRNGLKQSHVKFATHVFLDSGGYEAGADADLSEVVSRTEPPDKWLASEHREVLSAWNFDQPTVLVNFDTPRRRERFETQLSRAHRQRQRYAFAAHAFLAKPEPADTRLGRYYVDIATVIEHLDELTEFDIIGVTEKELGESMLVRLVNTALLRRALDAKKLTQPIHIFGSLDPMACPLFLIAGADIFDGLTWLRYAYHQGMAVYRQNILATEKLQPDTRDGELSAQIHVQNYHALGRLGDQMIRFAQAQDFAVFEHHGDYFEDVSQRMTRWPKRLIKACR